MLMWMNLVAVWPFVVVESVDGAFATELGLSRDGVIASTSRSSDGKKRRVCRGCHLMQYISV
jgi:hypothetical protein